MNDPFSPLPGAAPQPPAFTATGWDAMPSPAAAPAAPVGSRWQIAFTGSGSEYFRIWIVNLMLILVTLGLYLPFAKARRIQYFYANTRVDGHALAFHGNPWAMFRGFLLMAALSGVYAVASQYSIVGGLVALGVLCLVFPALWRVGLQFRLANTSWRGLRLEYRTGLNETYNAVLPIYLPIIVLGLLAAWGVHEFGGELDLENMDDEKSQLTVLVMLYMVGAMVIPPLIPWCLTLIKRVQHGGYAWAQERTAMKASVGDFYVVCLKGVVAYICAGMAFGAVALVLVGLAWLSDWNVVVGVFLSIVGLGAYVVATAVTKAWYTAGIQNLVWSTTRSANLEFHSTLGLQPLTLLNAKNFALTVVTLGLYYPFAAVNLAKMRLEAVSITAHGDVDSWLGTALGKQSGAVGDAAGDSFGIDLGL